MLVLETIGLALAVAPLIVELLKVNPEPIHALRAVKPDKAQEMMAEFYRDLAFEVSMLKITLAQLVRELPVDEKTKQKLVDESNLDHSVWKSPSRELRLVLERRLNPCYEPFVHSMEKILRLLSKLVDDKSLPVQLNSDQIRVCEDTPYSRLEDFFDNRSSLNKRLKLGWKKDKREKLMQGISKHNKRLENMLKRTSEAGTGYAPPQRSATVAFTPHLGLRQRLAELRKAIGRVWCKCIGKHELRLGLSKTWKSEEHVSLDMIMNLSKDTRSWHWGESKVNVHLAKKIQSPADRVDFAAVDQPIPMTHRRTSSSFTGATYVGESEVTSRSNSLSGATPVGSPSLAENEKEMWGFRKSSETLPGHFLVDDICNTVRGGQRVRKASLLHFRDDALWHNSITTESEVPRTHPGMTLEECLRNRKLTMKDRKILQVLLAQSVLFFPWAGQELNKQSIAFHHDLNKPFATLEPDHGHQNSLDETEEDEEFEYKPYNNEILAALATALLELELEKPIEDLKEEDDSDDDSTPFVANFWTTSRVLKNQELNMYKGCYEAIDACIRCDFEGDELSFDDPDFVQQVYERIVAPLEQELSRGFSLELPYFGNFEQDEGNVTTGRVPTPEVETAIQAPPSKLKLVERKRVKIAKFSEENMEEKELPAAIEELSSAIPIPA